MLELFHFLCCGLYLTIKKSEKEAIWYVTDIYSNLLLDYVVLIKRI